MLPDFTARYPDSTVDVIAANRYYDIIENGVDIAIRTKVFEADSNITIRRLAATRRILAASPSYIEKPMDRRAFRRSWRGTNCSTTTSPTIPAN